MKSLPLGATGTRVSALCLGAMNYGTKADERESMRMPDRYAEAGGSFIDTANNYAVWWRLAALRAVARETGATPVQVMYAWMLQSTPPVLPLVSAGSVAQLDENLGSLSLALSSEHMARLDGAGSAPGS